MSTPDTIIGNSKPSLATSDAPSKRRRLNFACNYCRSRKSRCDEQKPSCRACLAAGIPCVTVDRRRPGVSITRHEAGIPANQASVSSIRVGSQGSLLAETPIDPGPEITSAIRHRRSSAAVPLTPQSASEAHEEPQQAATSWRPQRHVENERIDVAADIHAETDHVEQTTRFSGRLPMLRPSMGSCTSELLTDWLDLAFHRLGLRKRLSPLLLSINSQTPTQQPSLRLDAPPLPDQATSQELLFLYLEEVNAVFPLLDAAKTSQMLESAIQLGPSQFSRDHGFLPLLIIYLVLGLGALSHDQKEWRDFSVTNLDFCRSFIGHMIGWNTIQAVQLMFLMSLCLKSHDQTAASWSALSLCISMATAQGLDRPGSPTRREQPHSATKQIREVDGLRTWWCIYCFERMLAFELGKPPLILADDCRELDMGSWSFSTDGRSHPRPIVLRILCQFADRLGEIGKSAIRSRNTEETAGSSGIDGAIKIKVKSVGESCAMLMKWADSLPDEYRPQSGLIYGTGSFPFASFISLQYNQALLIIMRNSLLVSNKAIQLAIDNVASGTPWEHVIRNGHSIATNAARRIVQLLIEVADSDMRPLLPSLSAPLHALYLLSINIIRHPKSRMVKSDIALINDAADFAKQQDEYFNANSKLHVVLEKLNGLLQRITSASKSATITTSMQKSGTATPNTRNPDHVVDDSELHQQNGMGQAGDSNHSFEAHNYEQMDMNTLDFSAIFGESPALSQDTGFSPEVMHDTGWDWIDFTQLQTRS